MKRYNTIASLFLATAMLFAACEKDENGLVSLNVEVDNYTGAGNTKMYVDENNYTHWTTGDQVNINGNSNTCSLNLTGEKAQITGVPSSDNGYVAIYPAGIANNFSATYSAVTVTLPSTQNYSEDGSGKQIINAPMCAYCSENDNTLTFRNLCSLLKVTVNNDRDEDITMQSITVTSADKKLSGEGTLDVISTGSGNHRLSMKTGASSYNYVKLDFSNVSETVSQGTSESYYIVVPAFAESDITISIVATSTGTLELSKTASDAELSANKIVQGPTLSLDGVPFVGSEDNPYKIYTLADLVSFRTNVNNGTTYEGKFFKLMDHIDCGNSWTPIGTTSNVFKGTFDGNDKTITYEIPSTSNNCLGFFGCTQNATIKNLNVNATISQTQTGGYNGIVGAIVGRQEGGLVDSCSATGEITSNYNNIGGIVGRNNGSVYSTVSNCSSSVNITSSKAGSNNIGGIIGNFYTAGTVTNCSASGNIYAPEGTGTYVGGIVGNTTGTTSVTGCGFTGHVQGSGYVGMVVGYKATKTTVGSCTYSAATAGVYKGVGKSGTKTGDDTGCTAQ